MPSRWSVIARWPSSSVRSDRASRDEAYRMLAKKFGTTENDRKGIALVGLRRRGQDDAWPRTQQADRRAFSAPDATGRRGAPV